MGNMIKKQAIDKLKEQIEAVAELQKQYQEMKNAHPGLYIEFFEGSDTAEKPPYSGTEDGSLETNDKEPEYGDIEDSSILPVDFDMVYLPYFGKTAAGIPLDIYAEPGAYMPFPRKALKGSPDEYFVLSVQGYSMIEADVNEGDMVVIRHSKDPINGKIMLVRHEGASTLKRLSYRAGKWYLCWDDNSGREIQVDSRDFEVQGLHVWTLKPGK
jgi:SOS-response transcriptional repressor LexA